jgi:hypothetical protein
MKYFNIIFALFFALSLISKAAFSQRSLQSKQLYIPDTIRVKIALFELKKDILTDNFDSAYMSMFVYKRTGDKLKFSNGLYEYKILSPHIDYKIFIFYNSKIFFFRNSYIDDVLEEYLSCIKQLNISIKDRIEYLNEISIFLKQEASK